MTETQKSDAIAGLTKEAAEAYDRIITRYPLMDRADDAKRRLAALHQPIPRPTKAAVAQNKAEEDSRRELTMSNQLMNLVKKGPDTSHAATVGDPPLADNEPVSATTVIRQESAAMMGAAPSATKVAGVEVLNQPPANAAPTADSNGTPASPFGAASPTAHPAAADPNELKPNVAADSNELKPIDTGVDPTLPPPPAQVNEIQQGSAASVSSDTTPASDQDISSSKKKKKKGLKKLSPF